MFSRSVVMYSSHRHKDLMRSNILHGKVLNCRSKALLDTMRIVGSQRKRSLVFLDLRQWLVEWTNCFSAVEFDLHSSSTRQSSQLKSLFFVTLLRPFQSPFSSWCSRQTSLKRDSWEYDDVFWVKSNRKAKWQKTEFSSKTRPVYSTQYVHCERKFSLSLSICWSDLFWNENHRRHSRAFIK